MSDLDPETEKRCDICRGSSHESINAELFFGPWMQKSNITVHYNCLLLSTNLLQNGEESCGIQRFLLRDIRAEIAAAGKRICAFCDKIGASIQCHKCKIHFDLGCGIRNNALFQFVGEFKSFCFDCIPWDNFQKKTKIHWKISACYICNELFSRVYIPTEQLYSPCCNKGFVHKSCMQNYALSAGYYLRCIFCRSTSFRESIKLQGIFVPDREAIWETKTRFGDFHRGHSRCDADPCLCSKGREYKSTRWNLINCILCGSFGVHYPMCVPQSKNGDLPLIEKFCCQTCELAKSCVLEKTVKSQSAISDTDNSELSIAKSSYKNNYTIATTSAPHENITPTIEKEPISNRNKISSNNNKTAEDCCTLNNVIDLRIDDNNSDWEEIELFDFTEDFEIVGKCKLRINMNSPRFANKTLKDIVDNPEIFEQSDIVELNGELMPFQKVENILAGKEGEEFLRSHFSQFFENGKQ